MLEPREAEPRRHIAMMPVPRMQHRFQLRQELVRLMGRTQFRAISLGRAIRLGRWCTRSRRAEGF